MRSIAPASLFRDDGSGYSFCLFSLNRIWVWVSALAISAATCRSEPTALSRTVEFLNGHGVEIDEVEITEDLLQRLDDSALTLADVEAIEQGKRVRPWMSASASRVS